jgi:LPXTG-motif cell wall-anchored protein
MDIGTTLLLLVGVGLIVLGGIIRRRSLAAHDARAPSAPAHREDG